TGPGGFRYEMPGLATAIMLEFPERVKRGAVPNQERELVFYLPRKNRLAAPLRDVFLEGLYWRSADSFTGATDRVLAFFLETDHEWTQHLAFEALFTLATRPGHPYSSERLWTYLIRKELAARDLTWSEFLRQSARDSSIHRLLEWVERTRPGRP